MSVENPSIKSFYFSTRDLLIMAILAALGGVASTYINTLSDAVHAVLGVPGATQWAAGLHVIWIVLAMGILRKPGSGTTIGILKGAVELMSGNSHGVIILLINIFAGLLVDFGFLLFNNKRSLLPFLIAGGLATGSNVLVFQLFATLPMNILGISAIVILFFVAFVSGFIFSGILPFLLINSLAKAGIVKTSIQPNKNRKVGWYILSGVLIIAVLITAFLRMTLQGAKTIQITGAVRNPYEFPGQGFEGNVITRQMEYKGVLTEYAGYALVEAVEFAEPEKNADTLLIEASDGYAFLISFDELQTNPNILAVKQGSGKNTSFDVVGPESSKAWVRNVTKLTVITSEGLTIIDLEDNTQLFDPDEWVSEMDSIQISLPNGNQKLQGVPLWQVIEAYVNETPPYEVQLSGGEEMLSLSWSEIDENNSLRLFTVIEEEAISFALAEMSGKVLIFPITKIEIK